MLLYHFFIVLTLALNFGLGIFVFERGPNKKTNRFYAYTIFSLVVWGAGALVMNYATTDETAAIGSKIAALGYIFMPMFFLFFTFAFTRREHKLHVPAYVILLLLSFSFLYLSWSTDLIIAGVQSFDVYHISIPGPYFFVLFVYEAILFGIALYTCFEFYRQARLKRERIEAKYILLATAIPLVLGVITDLWLNMAGILPIRFGAILTVINVIIISYAILRYRIMGVIDALGPEQIFAAMNDAVIVVDNELKILKLNDRAFEWLGYEPQEVIYRILPEFLKGESNLLAYIKGKTKDDAKMYLLTKQKKKIPVHVSASIIKDNSGDVLGAILVARDVRDGKLLTEVSHMKQELSSRLEQLEELRKTLK